MKLKFLKLNGGFILRRKLSSLESGGKKRHKLFVQFRSRSERNHKILLSKKNIIDTCCELYQAQIYIRCILVYGIIQVVIILKGCT